MLASFFLPALERRGSLMPLRPLKRNGMSDQFSDGSPRFALGSHHRGRCERPDALRQPLRPSSSSASARPALVGHPLSEFVPEDTPLFSLLEQVLATGGAVAENRSRSLRRASLALSARLRLSPIVDSDGLVAVSLVEQTIARSIDRQLSHRSAARSVSALAAMLAHEVKNPLSGIRGAAWRPRTVGAGFRAGTHRAHLRGNRPHRGPGRPDGSLRGRPPHRTRPHQHPPGPQSCPPAVAERFRQGVRFVETYDPSLPDVHGDRDQLIQVFLNLVKNACEVPGDTDREIELSTAYRHGLRLAVPGQQTRVNLPLVVPCATMVGVYPTSSAVTCLTRSSRTSRPELAWVLLWSPRSSTTMAVQSSSIASRVAHHSGLCCRFSSRRPRHERGHHDPRRRR